MFAFIFVGACVDVCLCLHLCLLSFAFIFVDASVNVCLH